MPRCAPPPPVMPSVALGVFAYFLTTAQRTSKKGAAAPEPPAIAARGASTKRLMPALGPDESGLRVERSLLVGRSLEPGRIMLRRGSHATRAVLRLERGACPANPWTDLASLG